MKTPGRITLLLAGLIWLSACSSPTGPQTTASPSVSASAAPASHHKVIVVGGGLAGLITCYELDKKGIGTVLLEAADRLGGRVATAHYADGLRAEYGMQEIWEKSPLLGVVKELGLQTESTDDAYSSLIIDGKLYPFIQPTRDAYFATLFTKPERAAFDATIKELESLFKEASEKGLDAHLQPLQDMSFADWLRGRHLSPKVENALRLTIEVELAASAEQFSALSAVLEWRTFLFGGEKNFHVQGGNQKLIDALAQHIHGDKILGARVTEVKRTQTPHGLEAQVTYQQGAEVKTMSGDAVVVAIPWIYLHLLQFTPPLSEQQTTAVNSLGRGQYVVVHIRMDKSAEQLWKIGKSAPFPILSDGPLGVIYGPHAQEAASGNDTLFGLLIYGGQAQAYHMHSRDLKRAEILAALDKQWPGFTKYVRDVAFYSYHPAAVAYWPIKRSPLDAASLSLRKPNQGLFLAGDWTVSSHSEGAAISALDVARQVEAFLATDRTHP